MNSKSEIVIFVLLNLSSIVCI